VERFWQSKTLDEMNDAEWESLCDGCARCCMIKLQDEDTSEIHYTALVCPLLQLDSCRCTRYADRQRLVPDCVNLSPQRALEYGWLPNTCAYRILAEGRDLAWWHPLVSGSAETVHEAGISVRSKVLPADQVHPSEHQDMVVKWVEQ